MLNELDVDGKCEHFTTEKRLVGVSLTAFRFAFDILQTTLG